MQKIGLRSASAVANPARPLAYLEKGSAPNLRPLSSGTLHSPTVRCNEARPDFPGDLGVSFSSPDGDSLMAGIDKPDTDKLAAHEKSIKMSAMESEYVSHAQCLETLREEVSAGELARFRELEWEARHRDACLSTAISRTVTGSVVE